MEAAHAHRLITHTMYDVNEYSDQNIDILAFAHCDTRQDTISDHHRPANETPLNDVSLAGQ